jgi:predicted PurR-regulated permease PerM
MTTSNPTNDSLARSRMAIDIAIRIGLIALLVYWCLRIFLPFLIPVLWAIIIAVAIYPVYQKLESSLGGKKKLALGLFTVIALSLLIVPTVMLADSMIIAAHSLAKGFEEGTLQIPPPPADVADWPLIGETLHDIWAAASNNLMATLEHYAPQFKSVGKWLLSAAAGAGLTLLQFLISILIAAFFIAKAEEARRFARVLSTRIAGDEGEYFSELASATMRSVAQGVLGVAFIQSLLAGIGMLVAGVPGAGLWALLVLILAVVQLPPLLVLGPVMIYLFSTADTVTAVLFLIWGLLVGFSDTLLKPLLLGRGVDVPMLVILIGAIGGMMFSGIIGLFIGAVVLALGYKLFVAWLTQEFDEGQQSSVAETEDPAGGE